MASNMMLVPELSGKGLYSCKIVIWDDVRIWKKAMDLAIPGTAVWVSVWSWGKWDPDTFTDLRGSLHIWYWPVRVGLWAPVTRSLSKKKPQVWANPYVRDVFLVNVSRQLNQKETSRLPLRDDFLSLSFLMSTQPHSKLVHKKLSGYNIVL